MKRLLLTAMLQLCFFQMLLHARDTDSSLFPRIGKPIADYTFKDLRGYPKKSCSISDFKGKWLMLDFWTIGCSSCIGSFPKMDTISKMYKDQMQLIMVGHSGTRFMRHTKALYEGSRSIYDLGFTVAFDSVLMRNFGEGGAPFIIIVDPEGIVRYITASVNKKEIGVMLAGGQPKIYRQYRPYDKEELERKPYWETYKDNLPFLTNGSAANGGNDTAFLFRSMLTPIIEGAPTWSRPDIMEASQAKNAHSPAITGNLNIFRSDLRSLYKIAYLGRSDWSLEDSAYYGKISPKIILEIKDPAPFNADWQTTQGYYNYSLTVPRAKASQPYMLEVMQRDLRNYFGYEVSMETRKMEVWGVIIIDAKKAAMLRTKGGKPDGTNGLDPSYQPSKKEFIAPYLGLWGRNYAMKSLIWPLQEPILIKYKYPYYEPPTVLDWTGIDYNIDFTIHAYMRDFDDLRKAYNKMGLDIVRREKDMQCLVIRDPS